LSRLKHAFDELEPSTVHGCIEASWKSLQALMEQIQGEDADSDGASDLEEALEQDDSSLEQGDSSEDLISSDDD
jgi:hypothetical protein